MTLEIRSWKLEAGRKLGKGFTLIETVIVIAITTMALFALVNLFILFNATYGYQQAFIATAGAAGTAMNALEAAVLPARRVLASRDFSGTAYASGPTALVLELPAIDSSGDIIPEMSDYVAFYTSGAILYRLTEANAGSARASGVKQLSATLNSLAFTYDNADFTQVTSVAADLETRALSKEQTVRSRLTGQWYLRNVSSTP